MSPKPDRDDPTPRSDTPPGPAAPAPPGAKTKLVGAAIIVGVLGLSVWMGLRITAPPARCGSGLVAISGRCCGAGQALSEGRCVGAPAACAPDQTISERGCAPAAPDARVRVEGGLLRLAPFDWEAQGVVAPHEAAIATFDIDRFEVTEDRYLRCVDAGACARVPLRGEPGLPISAATFDEAQAFCAWAGGRLPTTDERSFAAAGAEGRRYPWGSTGAVCRRGAWGLVSGPCGEGASGPDLAGAHPDGASPNGIHDLAGNVAEWALPLRAEPGAISDSPDRPPRPAPQTPENADVLGGSFEDAEASAMRTWNRRSLPRATRSASVGFRCVYAPRGGA